MSVERLPAIGIIPMGKEDIQKESKPNKCRLARLVLYGS